MEGWDDTYGDSDEDEGNTEAGSGEFDWNQLLSDMVRSEHVAVNTWKTWSMFFEMFFEMFFDRTAGAQLLRF